MPKVARDGDPISTGHDCDGVSTVTGPTGASAKVYANGIPVECLGNPTAVHTILVGDVCVPHTSSIGSASGSVFVSGIAIARLGDSVDAGSITGGSHNVYAGD